MTEVKKAKYKFGKRILHLKWFYVIINFSPIKGQE